MYNDDYDATAFQNLSPVLSQQGSHVMSRGVPGRHDVTSWFVNFYNIILKDQFGRAMSALNSYTLTWRHINTTTFMYGTKLRIEDDGTYFNNH